MSQNIRPQSYNILNKREYIVARKSCCLILITEKFNIKHDHDNAIPVTNTSAHPNLIFDSQNDKPTLENVYRAKSGRLVKKPKLYN